MPMWRCFLRSFLKDPSRKATWEAVMSKDSTVEKGTGPLPPKHLLCSCLPFTTSVGIHIEKKFKVTGPKPGVGEVGVFGIWKEMLFICTYESV